ncbi:MAG: hypothetical protein MPJ50_00765 [Pirellulales bacterium]|nr:hypothetical protein [Pirellulales bacterium]
MPEQRAKGDPLLLGIIRRSDRRYYQDEERNRLTFLVGWFINTREL